MLYKVKPCNCLNRVRPVVLENWKLSQNNLGRGHCIIFISGIKLKFVVKIHIKLHQKLFPWIICNMQTVNILKTKRPKYTCYLKTVACPVLLILLRWFPQHVKGNFCWILGFPYRITVTFSMPPLILQCFFISLQF